MFKIVDFSKLSPISVRMLRHDDHFRLFKPDYVDQYSGYRNYSAGKSSDLNRIIFFKDLGFILK